MRLRNVLIGLGVLAGLLALVVSVAWRLTSCHEPQQIAASAPAGVAPGTRVDVQGEKGTIQLAVTNDADAPVPVNLSSGPVTDAATGTEVSGAAVSFRTVTGNQDLPNGSAQAPKGTQAQDTGGTAKPAQTVTVPAHGSLGVGVYLTGIKGTGWARVKIFNQATEIASLDAVVVDDALNVAIDGLGSMATTPLPITAGQTVSVVLKNNSSETLALNCRAEVRDTSTACGRIILLPNGSKSVRIPLVCKAYRWTDWVHSAAVTGSLKLSMDVPAGTPAEMTPVKPVSLSLTMQGAGPIGEPILSTIYVMVFLLIGGLLSILSSSVLPTWIRKAQVRRQVDELASRTSNVSQNVDSYLRVLLRLERKKIQVQLDNVSAVSFTTSAGDQLTEITNTIASLMKRLVMAERLDELRRQFEVRSATAPPSITDQIDKNLDTAAGQLHSFVLNDADLEAAKGYLDKAQLLLKLLEDNDAQARLIAQNYVQLRNRMQAFPCDYYADLRQALWGIFDSLRLLDICGDGGGARTPADGAHDGNAGNGDTAPKPESTAGAGKDGDAKDTEAGGAGAGAEGAGAEPASRAPGDQPKAANSADQQGGDVKSGATGSEDAGGEDKQAAAEVEDDKDDEGGAGAANQAGQAKTGTDDPQNFANPKNIFPPMFFAIDHGIAAIQTVLDYAIVRRSVATGTSRSCTNPGQQAMERLSKHECDLLRLLGTLSWKSLRGAITLVQQMREDVYEEDVFSHFEEPKAKITFDTQRARPYQPVFFSIDFVDPRLKGAAALNWVTLDWIFPYDLHEKNWKVCHYFEGKEGKPAGKPKPTRLQRIWAAIRSWFRTEEESTAANHGAHHAPPGEETDAASPGMRIVELKVIASSPRCRTLTEKQTPQGVEKIKEYEIKTLCEKIKVQGERPKGDLAGVFADNLRFAIAFGVALLALQAGALEQLAKLGFVEATLGIIAAGFGADTVKNLLTQSPRPPTPAAAPPPTSKTGS